MKSSFECALYCHLADESGYTPDINTARLKAMLEHSCCTPLVVHAAEHVVRASLGIDPVCCVDWSCDSYDSKGKRLAFDWQAVLALITQLLAVLLPLFGNRTA